MTGCEVSREQFQSSVPEVSIALLRQELLRYCQLLSQSQDDAEDLVQIAFMKALPVLTGEQDHPNLCALLRRIAKNTWLDEIRRQRHGRVDRLDSWVNDIPDLPMPDTLAIEEAMQILVQLTPQQRTVVLLCDVFQYTDSEVGELLGITRGAVKASLHRARQRLKSYAKCEALFSTTDEPQKEILRAYVSAFQTADMRMLIQLSESGHLDSAEATSRVLTFALSHNTQSKNHHRFSLSLLAVA